MRPIFSSILFPVLLALFCEAYPASDSEKMTAEEFARFLDQYEKLKLDNPDADIRQRELPDDLKEVFNPRGMTSENSRTPFYDNEIEGLGNVIVTAEDLVDDYSVNKRTASKGKFNYYKCYFNPVTCYGK